VLLFEQVIMAENKPDVPDLGNTSVGIQL